MQSLIEAVRAWQANVSNADAPDEVSALEPEVWKTLERELTAQVRELSEWNRWTWVDGLTGQGISVVDAERVVLDGWIYVANREGSSVKQPFLVRINLLDGSCEGLFAFKSHELNHQPRPRGRLADVPPDEWRYAFPWR